MSNKATKVIIAILAAAVVFAGGTFALKTLAGGEGRQQAMQEQHGESMAAASSTPANTSQDTPSGEEIDSSVTNGQ